MQVEPNSSIEEQNQVLTWLREFNEAHNREFMNALANDAEEAFFLVSRNDQNEVIGGIAGTILLKWLKIYVTAVSPAHRKQGIGKDLLIKAEQHARSQGCQYVYVDTMSFQAYEFYLKSGYTEVGRYKDWDSHGHDKIYLQKVL
jgi:GNAT superfamily N-acetyltransferase